MPGYCGLTGQRFCEHPATVLVVTNLYYAEAPWLTPRSVTSAQGLIWKDVALTGNTAHGFAEQIGELEGFLAENWRAGISPTTGNPVYQRPVILTLRREDHSFLLDPIMPGAQDYQLSLDRMATSVWAGADPMQALQTAAAEWDATTENLGADAQKAFYEEFPTREALLLEVATEIVGSAAERLEAALVAAPKDLGQRVRAGLTAYIGYLTEDPRRIRIAYREVRIAPLEAERQFASVSFAALVAEQVAQLGIGRHAQDNLLLALALTGGVGELLNYWTTAAEKPSTERLVDELTRLYVAALR